MTRREGTRRGNRISNDRKDMAYSERRFELRDRTRDGHERLDAAVGAFDSLRSYSHYVGFLGTFRATMDDQLAGVVWPLEWSWRPTMVSAALAQDAQDLGLDAARSMKAAIDLRKPSALLGALYVLEGSTLGARVLRQRAAGLGMTGAFGARHLSLMSNDMAQWQSFLLLLDDACDFDMDHAAAAANEVFALALRCFESGRVVYQ
jgi:heme oxygenase